MLQHHAEGLVNCLYIVGDNMEFTVENKLP